MATARTPVPPVNLKDRIAALQQNKAPSRPADPKAPAAANPACAPGSLKDKIATFEKKGAVPAPRGSFGIGAPPVDDGSTRRHGELYGNRVPGLSRPTIPVPNKTPDPAGPDSPPASRKRCVSTSLLSDASLPDAALASTSDASMDVQASVRTSPRRASVSVRHYTQRSVSDIMPTLRSFEPVEETLSEHDMPDATPMIVVSSDAPVPGASVAQAEETEHVGDTPAETDVVSGNDDVEHGSALTRSIKDRRVASGDYVFDAAGAYAPAPQIADDGVQNSARRSDTETHQIEAMASVAADGRVGSSPSIPTVSASAAGAHDAQAEQEATPQPSSSLLAAESANDLSEAHDASSVSVADRTSYSSSSTKVSTPNSVVEFSLAQSSVIAKGIDSGADASSDALALLEPRDAMSPPPPNLAVLIPATPQTTDKQGLAYLDENPDQSLALDASEAVIISEPPRHVSPTLLRATLVPVPSPVSPAASASSASPISPASTSRVPPRLSLPVSPASSTVSPSAPFVEPALTPPSAPRSFRAVVHGKVTQGSAATVSRSSVSPSPKARVSAPSLEPSSPGFGDLATLWADAALLERQLSGLGLPPIQAEDMTPEPLTSATEAEPETVPEPVPEQETHAEPASRLESVFEDAPELWSAERPQPAQELPESVDGHDDSDASLASPVQVITVPSIISTPQHAPTPPAAPVDSHPLPETPPPVPPKSPPRSRYFSTLLPRKLSTGAMPGSYPRDSVCSEMSSDDSVLVATPPSPRADTLSSDASSVRSSTRSWKMGRKGLARATSFADRFLHRKDKMSPPLPDDDVHLSPHGMPLRTPPSPTAPQHTLRPQLGMSDAQRPASWVSVSSVNSVVGPNGELLDSELFDAFPSVPDSMPHPPPYLPPSSHAAAYLSPAGHPGESMHASRAATLPARSSGHPKQRSGLF